MLYTKTHFIFYYVNLCVRMNKMKKVMTTEKIVDGLCQLYLYGFCLL